ncbi:MAG TPA: hypothetical protein VFN05_17295 [Actinomycetes bacterium]|nr:hypothetical protein [Actinomycetes bacterium]
MDGGGYHTCLRTRGGAVYCWGQGAYGQLGTNTHFRGTPTRSLVDDVVEIQAGGRFTCARQANGEVSCWGEDDHAQLGRRATEPCGDAEIDSICAPTPQPVRSLGGATGLAAGESHACALLRGGAVSCWGSNEHGQLGGSAAGDRATPSVVAGVSGVAQVIAGDNHTCALIGRPGRVRCWGDNETGQAAGDGARVTRPVTVPGLSDAVELAGGGAHTCARRAGGSVACWGYNYLGQLGVGSTRPTSTNRPLPVRHVTDAVQLTAGRYHTCVRRQAGGVACWGPEPQGRDRRRHHHRPVVPDQGTVGQRRPVPGRWPLALLCDTPERVGVVLGRQPRRPARHRRRQRRRQPGPGAGPAPAPK